MSTLDWLGILGSHRSRGGKSRRDWRRQLQLDAEVAYSATPRWVCLECRAHAEHDGGDPMRRDILATPTTGCSECGAMSWVDANSARVREQLVSIDAFEISQRHRPWGRILTRGAAAAGAGWALLNTYVLMPDAVTSVFGGVVIIVVTLMLVGIWMATSPGFTPR